MEGWLSSLLNCTPVVKPLEIEERDDLDFILSPIAMAEVTEDIKKIKTPGNIPPEVMKAGAGVIANIIIKLLSGQKVEVPTE